MRRALLKTAFGVAVLGSSIVFVVPAMIALQAVFAVGRGAGGHSHGRGGVGLLLAIVVMVVATTLSDRVVSYLFWAGGHSDGRGTIKRKRRRSRRMN